MSKRPDVGGIGGRPAQRRVSYSHVLSVLVLDQCSFICAHTIVSKILGLVQQLGNSFYDEHQQQEARH